MICFTSPIRPRRQNLLPDRKDADWFSVRRRIKAANLRLKLQEENSLLFVRGSKRCGSIQGESPFHERTAVKTGELQLGSGDKPVSAAIFAATPLIKNARRVISDDPRFMELGLRAKWTQDRPPGFETDPILSVPEFGMPVSIIPLLVVMYYITIRKKLWK